jgi:hypothetical protein
MSGEPRLRDRDWTHAVYEREMRIKILRHKLRPLVTEDKRGLTFVEERLVSSASILVVSLWEREREFAIAQPAIPISKDYLPMLRELKSVLNQLGLSLDQARRDEASDFDLASVLAS